MKTKIYTIISFAIFCIFSISCKKYLDKIPNQKLAVISSLNDLSLLLDNYSTMNNSSPNSLEILADNYYVTSNYWSGIADERIRNQYIWAKDESNDWAKLYKAVFTANIVLDHLGKIKFDPVTEQNLYNEIKGSAMFFRAHYLFLCAGLFGQPYEKNTASTDPGIVLRLSSDFNEKSVRANNEQTYHEIIKELKEAAVLLPTTQELVTRPSKVAAYGAIARAYLITKEYDSAGLYSDLCISTYGSDKLLNFSNISDVNPSATAPFKRFNKEVLFHCSATSTGIISASTAKIDSLLYASYSVNDLRRTAYFKANTGVNVGTVGFKGDYGGSGTSSGYAFSGIVLDEMYLIRSECFARTNNIVFAMRDLNKLLTTRWKLGTYIPLVATDSKDALYKVLMERRKELLFRGTRWTDLRRLRNDADFLVIPKRNIDGKIYQLLPDDPRYTVLIPWDVITLANILQNP